jgi:hypothetical protein
VSGSPSRPETRGDSARIEELAPVLLGHEGQPLPVYGTVGLLSLLPVAPHHFSELMTQLLGASPNVLKTAQERRIGSVQRARLRS